MSLPLSPLSAVLTSPPYPQVPDSTSAPLSRSRSNSTPVPFQPNVPTTIPMFARRRSATTVSYHSEDSGDFGSQRLEGVESMNQGEYHLGSIVEPSLFQPNLSRSPSSLSPQVLSNSPLPPLKLKASHARKTPEGHVKRPPNAFILFRSHCCLTTPGDPQDPPAPSAAQLAELGITDHRHISRIVSHLWTSLPPEEKLYWENKAREKKEEHNRLHPDYKFKPVYRDKNEVRRKRRAGEGEVELEKTGCKEVAMALLSREVADDGTISFGAIQSVDQQNLAANIPKKRRPHRRTRPRDPDKPDPPKRKSKAKPKVATPRTEPSSPDDLSAQSGLSRSQTAPLEPRPVYPGAPESYVYEEGPRRIPLPPLADNFQPTYLERLQGPHDSSSQRTIPPPLHLYQPPPSPAPSGLSNASSRVLDQSALANLRRYNIGEPHSNRFSEEGPGPSPTSLVHPQYPPLEGYQADRYYQPPLTQYARRVSSIVGPLAFRGAKRGEMDRFASGAGDLMLTSPTFGQRNSSIGRWNQENGDLLRPKQEGWSGVEGRPETPSTALVFDTDEFLRSVESGEQDGRSQFQQQPGGRPFQHLQQSFSRRPGTMDPEWGRRISDLYKFRGGYHVGEGEMFNVPPSPLPTGPSPVHQNPTDPRAPYPPLSSASSSSNTHSSASSSFPSERHYASSHSSYATSPRFDSPMFGNPYDSSSFHPMQHSQSLGPDKRSLGSLVAASQFSAHGELAATISHSAPNMYAGEGWHYEGGPRGSDATMRGGYSTFVPRGGERRRSSLPAEVDSMYARRESGDSHRHLSREEANNVELVQYLLDSGFHVTCDPPFDSSMSVPGSQS